MGEPAEKVCGRCQECKPADQFYRRAGGGLLAYCRPCHSQKSMEAQRRRRGDHPLLIQNLTAGLPAGMKRCGSCKVELPISEFPLHSGRPRSLCLDCHNDANRGYKATHAEVVRASNASYRERNRELLAERQRKWRAENPEAYQAIHSRWKAGNKSAVNAATHRRRNQIAESEHHWTAAEWEALKARCSYSCLMCHRSEPAIKLTVDHIRPVALGGSNSIRNIQPLCKSCNSRKHLGEVDLLAANGLR